MWLFEKNFNSLNPHFRIIIVVIIVIIIGRVFLSLRVVVRQKWRFEKDKLIEFLVIESENRNVQLVHLVINNTSSEYRIVDGFLWVDLNYEVKEVKLTSKYFCEFESITFYGRN